MTKSFKIIYNFFNKKWYFDRIYNQLITNNILYCSYAFSYKDIDRGILEMLGPYGIIRIIKDSFNFIKTYQTGNIFHYLFIFFISIIIILFGLIFALNFTNYVFIFVLIGILYIIIFILK